MYDEAVGGFRSGIWHSDMRKLVEESGAFGGYDGAW